MQFLKIKAALRSNCVFENCIKVTSHFLINKAHMRTHAHTISNPLNFSPTEHTQKVGFCS